eukprot:s1039_g3.t1
MEQVSPRSPNSLAALSDLVNQSTCFTASASEVGQVHPMPVFQCLASLEAPPILASREPEEVLELCEQHLVQFDMVNLPTALQCLARMSADPSDAPHDPSTCHGLIVTTRILARRELKTCSISKL